MQRDLDGVFVKRPQPREHHVLCPFHDPRHPTHTWNYSGLCDLHEAQKKDDQIFNAVKEYHDELA